MAGRDPAWVGALKELRKKETTAQEFQAIVDEMFSVKDDRGVALMAGGLVEAALDRFLRASVRGSTSKIFGRGGPLDTFAKQIMAAYSFGLIDKEVRDDLDRLREIRNTFAHTRAVISFSTQAISEACLGFKAKAQLAGAEFDSGHPRSRYLGVSMSLLFVFRREDGELMPGQMARPRESD